MPPNFAPAPVGNFAGQLGLTLDGRDPMQTMQDSIKKRQKMQAQGTPNNYSPFNPLSAALLSNTGNQY